MVQLVFNLLTLTLIGIAGAYPASSRQLLPPKPGYVPVYIRNGDTPLEDINLELAEAFHAIPSGRSAGRNDIMAQRSNDDENVLPKTKEELIPEVKVEKENKEKKIAVQVEELDDDVNVKNKDGQNNEYPNEITKQEDKAIDSKLKNVENEHASEHIQKIAKIDN